MTNGVVLGMCRVRPLPVVGTSGTTCSFNSFWLEPVRVFILPGSVLLCLWKLKNPAGHARGDGAAVWVEIDGEGIYLREPVAWRSWGQAEQTCTRAPCSMGGWSVWLSCGEGSCQLGLTEVRKTARVPDEAQSPSGCLEASLSLSCMLPAHHCLPA